MQQTSLHVKCLLFLASLTLSYSRHTLVHYPEIESILSNNEKNDNLCTTPGCVKSAATTLSNLDETVDPCDNFYRFACGGWLSSHVIPEDKTSMTPFAEMNDDMNLQLKTLMDKELDGTEPSFVKMLKNMYDSCMDLESIDNLGNEPLKRTLSNLGGWPVIEGSKWSESKFEWVDTLIGFRRLGFDYTTLMTLSVKVDERNNSAHIIYLDQANLGMPDREYLIQGLNDSATAAYYKLMVEAAILLGADESVAKEELMKALQFEMDLAKLTVPEDERRDINDLYNKYTVKELQNMIPQIPWLRCFNGLLNDEIHEEENIVVREPDFLKDLASLLENTEKRVIANYMFWRLVSGSMFLLSKEWRDIKQEYDAVLKGQSQETPRWEQCISFMSGYLKIAIGSYYVRHYFKEDSKKAALEMTKYILSEFLNILYATDWMGYETKKQAIEKAKSMKAYIGYPEELLNDTAVTEVYKKLSISSRSYFKNVMDLSKWISDDMFSKLRKPYIKGDWKTYAQVAYVNAYYTFEENSIAFPAAILQGIFFDKDRPNYMNFGGIGYAMGHEVTHGFDDMGRQFDKDGNNVNWWDEATDEKFKRKAQCIIEQYGNYTSENGMKVNGALTQGENIADFGGLKESYMAYHSWVEDNGPEPLLPGLKYTQSQLFWISAANVWCGKVRPEQLKTRILNDVHSPHEFRVIGPMSNLPEFSRDFNCAPDSPMNKKNKCQVW